MTHPYYSVGLIFFVALVSILYGRRRAKRKAARRRATESLAEELRKLNIDPTTWKLDTGLDRLKAAIGIKLEQLKRDAILYEEHMDPVFLELFLTLRHRQQEFIFRQASDKRTWLAEQEDGLRSLLDYYKNQLDKRFLKWFQIDVEFSVDVERSALFEGFLRVQTLLEHTITELSTRMLEDDDERRPTGIDESEELPDLERKYSWLKDATSLCRDTVADQLKIKFQDASYGLEEERASFRELARAERDQQDEVLSRLRRARVSIPNYYVICRKYLRDQTSIISVIKRYDEALAEAVRDVQDIISHPETTELQKTIRHPEPERDHSDEVPDFVSQRAKDLIERSIPRKTVMTVKDIVVAYEHQYDSIQNLVRGFFSPTSIQESITEILTANPDADLKPLEETLGIKVISVQRKGAQQPVKKAAPISGLFVGSDE